MVSTENLGRIIDEHPFFEGIEAKLRALLVGCAKNERFEAGQFLAREGQKSDRFFLVRAGTVSVEVDVPGRPPIIIETVGEGDILGWSWIVEPYRSSLDARAVTLVRALSFDAACLRKKMAADAALGYEVLRRFVPVMAHRLQSARLQMLDLYGPSDMPVKVAAETKAKVIRAVSGSRGRNRAPDARLAAAVTIAQEAKGELKLAKKATKKKADKKTAKKASKAVAGKKKAG